MPLTRDFKITVVERLQREPELARAMYAEAMDLLQNGEPEAARGILRTIVYATVGFEKLAHETDGAYKSIHRMLSPHGNPSMNNLSALLKVIRQNVEPKPRRRNPPRTHAIA